ncbi:hypothetical protein B0H11DRAFT_2164125 [Mycena galericulata]|nr:hypothetical protein B0H11DRAFT_2164125 [Mycena galericulata]
MSAFVTDGLRSLLDSLAAPAGSTPTDYTAPESPPMPRLIDWGLSENTELEASAEAQALAQIAQKPSSYLNAENSDDENEERSDDEDEREEIQEPTVTVDNGDEEDVSNEGQKRARTRDHAEYSRQWYPWSDRILFTWLLKVNNVDDVPSVSSMMELNSMLQKLCGIESIPYNGALGHKYYVNSLSQIIAQEMSNPKVRPHLDFYPEDSGKILDEARQGKRWLEEMPAQQTTPMARIGTIDYFIYEPAIWRVVQRESEVSQDKFLKNLTDLKSDFHRHGIPDPTNIKDVMDPANGNIISEWTLTSPVEGNPWRERERAKGSRVYAFPIWLYCDDTSGNLSKKWNEHNSFLFTPAGLPREQAQKEFNIYFLSTSNIAPPLEMLDGILDQLEYTQKDGIWAWDCELNELVLIIPAVLARLGDNPMQSEFACHIGLRGKFFCRACWVKGSDNAGESNGDDPTPAVRGDGNDSDAESQGGSDVVSDAGSDKSQQSVEIEDGSALATKVQKMRTASGIKDTYQLVFLEKLFASYKGKRGKAAKQAALDAEQRRLPKNTTSPVWRIEGLDPHQDTPVEILHVILLGFVKYLWRDLVQNQLKNNDAQKTLLETRLNSFDVKGLGISPLAGHTLVQYSGSLTGRDFRAIAQAAPFVVYDMVSADCLATWVALSKLIPLIWQPKIKDIESHLALLTTEIDYFLTCAGRWTTRWFNKPKFHIFLHLPEHIRRFGPAILFATEAFESFNAVIRAKSVHSNRHAPSRDFAHAFAQGNRIRHLLSGGL